MSWLPAFKRWLLDGTQANLPACFTSLVEGIVPFCVFVKLPTGFWEHTSLSTSVAEDGGFSRQQAQIWTLGEPQYITLNRLVTPVQVHFLLSVSPSQSNEMNCENLAIIYQFIHWGCFTPLLVSHAAGTVNAQGIIFTAMQPNCDRLKTDMEFSDSIAINKKNDKSVKLLWWCGPRKTDIDGQDRHWAN